MRKSVLFLLILGSCFAARANNVQLQGTVKVVSATGSLVTMEVELSWDNSWRDDYNWDAVWLFFKYKVGVDGAWTHAMVNTAGATITGGDYTTMSGTTGGTATGLFIYPSKDRGGNTGSMKAQIQWPINFNKAQFDNNDIFVVAHGIEMVYIPYGAYTIGDGSSAGAFDKKTIDSEAAYSTANAAFPKGYQGFYVMKYETSQEEYVEFLNTLTLAQQQALIPGVDALSVGDFVFGANKKAPNNRNGVILSGKIAGKPLFFDNNLNNNKVYGEDADGSTLAMNYMSITDACGYASWAGLRPMTEMEYEKACRRPYPQEPDAGEYAWNSATGVVDATGVSNSGKASETVNSGNVNANGGFSGPVRCGAFARSGATNQAASGATYWGVMEMSGNVAELCATIKNTTISRTTNGAGTYNVNLWGAVPDCYGTRGGGFLNIYTTLSTSDRSAVSRFTTILQRDSTVGFRCAFTYNASSVVSPGTLADVAAICPGDRVAFSGTPASAGAVKITGYVWSVKVGTGAFTVIPGEGGATLAYTGFVAGKTYVFQRKAICPLGESSVSTPSLTVLTPVSITTQPTDQDAICGLTLTLSASGSAPLSYQWYKNGTPVSGATTATYTKSSTTLSDVGTYHCVVSNACGSLNSTQVQVTIGKVAAYGTLTDPRDGKQYKTRILADGREWMVEDLRFGTCDNAIFGANYTGSAVGKIAPGYYGVCIASTQSGAGYLYNWQAAMNASNAVYNTSGNPSGNVNGNSTRQWQGICPTGWHLPSGGSTGEYQQLYTALCSRVDRIYPGADDWRGVLGGYGSGSSVTIPGSTGYYWSSTYYSTNHAYVLNFSSGTVYPQSILLKYYGSTVRCLKNY